jgi:hypothetical protein
MTTPLSFGLPVSGPCRSTRQSDEDSCSSAALFRRSASIKTASTGFGGFIALISNDFGTRGANQSLRLNYPSVVRKTKRFPASEPDIPHRSQDLHILQTPLN